jgi:hypothetical protein
VAAHDEGRARHRVLVDECSLAAHGCTAEWGDRELRFACGIACNERYRGQCTCCWEGWHDRSIPSARPRGRSSQHPGELRLRGVIETPGAREAFKHVPAFEEGARTKTIINRLGSPQDVAWGMVYLCSDEASWITGTHLSIDGGASAW